MDTITILLIVSIIVIAGLTVAAFYFYKKFKSASDKFEIDISEANNRYHAIIDKYQRIVDIDAEIDKKRIVFEEQKKEQIHKIRQQFEVLKLKIKKERDDFLALRATTIENDKNKMLAEKAEMEKMRAEDERIIEVQRIEVERLKEAAEHLVELAKIEASEIASEACKVKENASHYEQVVVAMKNTINGYGDEYLVPGHSILDELAEEFTHKEAGVELANTRKYVKTLIGHGSAAKCEYVAAAQKHNAIHFVLDAFNGKVDTILSLVKKDNYGKLDQMLKDAFHLVNKNGMVFRNAMITHEYLEARRVELKWAVAVVELKAQEVEEQRRIKQEMREEEKAVQEYERTLRETEKEEALLKKAMDKARSELEAATEEQRKEFEQELENLQQRLLIAEEKNKRALSMAQQTRRGHVYIISNIGSFGDDVFKIGMTRRLEPTDRVRELGDASVPFSFDIHAMIFSEDAPSLERNLHQTFNQNQMNKINFRKEFFKVGIHNIKQTVEDLGIEAKWTMMAEAREYRESQAMLQQYATAE